MEEKHGLEIGTEIQSDSKCLYGGGAVGITPPNLSKTRRANQMFLLLDEWLRDWTEGFVEDGVINRKLGNNYIRLLLSAT